jgi:fructokinase
VYGAIEAGGTKWVCAVGTGPDDLRVVERFSTTTPTETLGRAVAFFQAQQQHTPLAAIGIGSFGPVDLNPRSATYGFITSTPKPGWPQTDVAGAIGRATGAPVGFDTDVNGAALGEYRWGAGQGLDILIYLTVGTGLGGGVLIDGHPVHGLVHPEVGHMRLPRDPQRDPFAGVCPFHGDCLEGLVAGPALEARWGARAETFAPDHPAWELEAHYLALALVNLICVVSPQRIIMGGGVMAQRQIFPPLRRKVQALLNNYVHAPELLDRIDEYIVPPGLGDNAGILGAIALAQRASMSP